MAKKCIFIWVSHSHRLSFLLSLVDRCSEPTTPFNLTTRTFAITFWFWFNDASTCGISTVCLGKVSFALFRSARPFINFPICQPKKPLFLGTLVDLFPCQMKAFPFGHLRVKWWYFCFIKNYLGSTQLPT